MPVCFSCSLTSLLRFMRKSAKDRCKIFPVFSLGSFTTKQKEIARNAFVQSSLSSLLLFFGTFLYLICSLGPLG